MKDWQAEVIDRAGGSNRVRNQWIIEEEDNAATYFFVRFIRGNKDFFMQRSFVLTYIEEKNTWMLLSVRADGTVLLEAYPVLYGNDLQEAVKAAEGIMPGVIDNYIEKGRLVLEGLVDSDD